MVVQAEEGVRIEVADVGDVNFSESVVRTDMTSGSEANFSAARLAMFTIVVSQMVVLHVVNSEIGVKRVRMQDLKGQIIHDDGSAVHGRCQTTDFIEGSLKRHSDITVSGATGVDYSPILGKIKDGKEELRGVIYLQHQDYGIDSHYQLIEVQKYKEDKSVGQNMKRYYKVVDGEKVEKLYMRKPEWTHFIRVNAISTLDKGIQKIINKMAIIHENFGHPTADELIQMCDNYPVDMLGFTKFEAKVWKKHGECMACLDGKSTAQRKSSDGRLIYEKYASYGDMEGLHFDVFYINQEWAFLLVKSHKHKMTWVFNVGTSFTSESIKDSLDAVLGDYRQSGHEIGFVRSDADPKFQPLRPWVQRLGIRYYMAPKGIKTSRGERGIRTERYDKNDLA